MTPNRWFDLGLNMFAEVLGIVATVFLVDRLIKRREEARWKPTKYIVYTKLALTTRNVFIVFLPQAVRKQVKISMYKFDKFSENEFQAIKINDEVLSELELEIYDDLSRDTSDDLQDKQRTLNNYVEELSGIVNDSAFFLDPELLSLLLILNTQMKHVASHISSLSPEAAQGRVDFMTASPTVLSISRLLIANQNLQKWIEQQAQYERSLNISQFTK